MSKEMSFEEAFGQMKSGSIVLSKRTRCLFKIESGTFLSKHNTPTDEWEMAGDDLTTLMNSRFTLVEPEQKFKEVVMYAPVSETLVKSDKLFEIAGEALNFNKYTIGYVPVTVFIKE